MPQADRQRVILKLALFLGGLLLFGFALQDLNRRSSPERERWSLAPGPGVTVKLDRPADIFRELEWTDGSLELPARWLEILPSPGYLIANSIVKSLASDLLLDTRYPVELGYRTTGHNEGVRFVVVSTKNSAIASANLGKLLDVGSGEGQVATIRRGALIGQTLVWRSARGQLAVVVGSSKDVAQHVLDQIKPAKEPTSKGVRFSYQGVTQAALIDSLRLALSFEGLALKLKGEASTRGTLSSAPIDKEKVHLAVRSTSSMQPVWVFERPDGSWCQRGLTPVWQEALGATERCANDPPLGAYVHLSGRIFERLGLPWSGADVTFEQTDQSVVIAGEAVATATPRFFPIYKMLRSIGSKAGVE